MQSQHCRRNRATFSLLGVVVTLALAGGECRAGFMILHNDKDFDFSTSFLTASEQAFAKQVFDAAMATWQSRLGTPPGKDITVYIGKVHFTLPAFDKDDGENGFTGNGETEGASMTNNDPNNLIMKVKEIDISTDLSKMYYGVSSDVPKGQRDAYSTMQHEVGHAIGLNYLIDGDGYQLWNNRIDSVNGTFRLSDGTLVNLAGPNGQNPDGSRYYTPNDLSHVADPNDLMSLDGGGLGRRFSPSLTDLQMLSSAFGYTITGAPEPASLTLFGIGAAVLGGYGWRRRRQVA